MNLTGYACEILAQERIAKAQHEAENERAAWLSRASRQTGGQQLPRAMRLFTWLRGRFAQGTPRAASV